jgi:zinc resistance-associated protein
MSGTKVMVTVVSVLFLAVAVTAYAGPGWGCGGGWCGGGFGPGPSRAKLTPDQQKKADALRLDFFKKTEPLRSEMFQKRLELRELLTKDNPDEQAVQKKREEIWALQDKMVTARRAMGTKMRGLLTPEQRTKIGPLGPGGFGRGGCWAAGYGRGGRGRGGCPGPYRNF